MTCSSQSPKEEAQNAGRLAKDLLRRNAGGVAEIAERVGFNSASTFSAAFARHGGQPPT